jgi:hypothetical protein
MHQSLENVIFKIKQERKKIEIQAYEFERTNVKNLMSFERDLQYS